MKTTLQLNRFNTIKVNFAALIAFFAKVVYNLPRLTRRADDPASLRYIASKYNGEGD